MAASLWEPLFSGDDARRCWSRAENVRRAVHGEHESRLVGRDWGPTLLELYSGKAGLALDYDGRLDGHLETAIDRLSENVRSGLYGGIAGRAWLLRHVDRMRGQESLDFAEVDAALSSVVSAPPNDGIYDLVGGPVGIAVYFLEGPLTDVAADALRKIARYLIETSIKEEPGCTWLTPPMGLPPWQRAVAPEGYYNLGVAHGIPGILYALAAIRAQGIASAEIDPVLEAGVAWLLTKRIGNARRFASWIAKGGDGTEREAQLAWCYGSLGVALALHATGRFAGRSDWTEAALSIADGELDRDAAPADAGICHGSGGIAHLFNRLSFRAGERRYADAGRKWMRRVLSFQPRTGAGVGGYQMWTSDGTAMTRNQWEDSAEFLTGATGTALALLAASTKIEPEWDRVLLI